MVLPSVAWRFHGFQHSSEADPLSNHPCRVSTMCCSSLCVFCISRYRRDTMEHTILVRTVLGMPRLAIGPVIAHR